MARYSALGLKDLFPFGKYKGCLVQEVLVNFPDYVRWLTENTETEFTNEAWAYFTARHGSAVADV